MLDSQLGRKVQNGLIHMTGSWCWLPAGVLQFSTWPLILREVRLAFLHNVSVQDSKRAKVEACKTLRPRLQNVHNVTSATMYASKEETRSA